MAKLSYASALAKAKAWRGLEIHRYRKWGTYASKRRQTAGVKAQRSRWWGLYSEAHTNRVAAERKAKSLAPRFRPGYDVSTAATNFIKSYEGYIGRVYNDGTGVMTVGYGHIENVPGNGLWVPNQKQRYRLTEAEASELLHKDLEKHYAPAVRALRLKTDSEFAAVLSFVYNCGVGAIGSGTTVGRLLKSGQIHAAANALLAWDKAGGSVLPGLLRRREAERAKLLH